MRFQAMGPTGFHLHSPHQVAGLVPPRELRPLAVPPGRVIHLLGWKGGVVELSFWRWELLFPSFGNWYFVRGGCVKHGVARMYIVGVVSGSEGCGVTRLFGVVVDEVRPPLVLPLVQLPLLR